MWRIECVYENQFCVWKRNDYDKFVAINAGYIEIVLCRATLLRFIGFLKMKNIFYHMNCICLLDTY